MVIVIDQKFRQKIREHINKQCPLCGRDIFASDDIVYTKHKQGETIVHSNCYNKLLKKRGKKNGFRRYSTIKYDGYDFYNGSDYCSSTRK